MFHSERCFLRVATLWQDSVVSERLVKLGAPVRFGTATSCEFVVPESAAVGEKVPLFRTLDGRPVVMVPQGSAGELKRFDEAGIETDVASLGPGLCALAPGMRGLFNLGPLTVFFEVVRIPPRSPWTNTLLRLEARGSAALLGAGALHLALLLVGFLLWQDPAVARAAAVQPERVPQAEWAEVPVEFLEPPTVAQPRGEPARAMAGDTGKFGDRANTQRSKIARREAPLTDRDPRTRLEKTLSSLSREGPLQSVLGRETNFTAKLAVAMSGTDDTEVYGRGTGGTDLRGVGNGGGGTSIGSIGGMGGFDTGGGGGGKVSGGLNRKTRQDRREDEQRVAAPPPVGFCKESDVRRVVEGRRAGITHCYEKALGADPELSGKVTLLWRIDTGGAVQSVRVESTTLRDRATEECMRVVVSRWHFPRPEGGQCQIRYPFVFNGPSGALGAP